MAMILHPLTAEYSGDGQVSLEALEDLASRKPHICRWCGSGASDCPMLVMKKLVAYDRPDRLDRKTGPTNDPSDSVRRDYWLS